MRSPGFSVMGTTVALGCSGRKLSPDSSARSRAWTLASRAASLPHALVRKRSRSSVGVMSSACTKISFSRLDSSAMAMMPIVLSIQQCDVPEGFGPRFFPAKLRARRSSTAQNDAHGVTRPASKILFQFLIKPGAGISPSALGGSFGNSQQPGRVHVRQAGEEPELDQLRAERIARGQLVQSLVHRQQVFIMGDDRDIA